MLGPDYGDDPTTCSQHCDSVWHGSSVSDKTVSTKTEPAGSHVTVASSPKSESTKSGHSAVLLQMRHQDTSTVEHQKSTPSINDHVGECDPTCTMTCQGLGDPMPSDGVKCMYR